LGTIENVSKCEAIMDGLRGLEERARGWNEWDGISRKVAVGILGGMFGGIARAREYLDIRR